MEELYSFSRHEWKRKSDPLPITGSHVLSLIASQERGPAPLRPADEPEPEPQPEPAGAVPGKAERSAAPTAPARASHDPRRSSNPDKPLGPRLIAPPSFDGTTMRFVVEHR
ncbi:hypothetical protein Y1Q_0019467 [Alligator mississippiensis]|uniref:Uncharacterized protein n=1 Tax=Alligator mississippiensis TaxID=8496 RepID=A0A151NME7_ALLMI|nr:hypothetical protein Y1Q_0019467 [Alligator mississippiensis]